MSECKHEVWTFPTQPVSVCEECERTSAELEYEKRIAELEAESHVLEEERNYWKMTAKKLQGIKAENKALREAAQAVVEWSADNFDIDHCKEFHVLAALTKEEL